MSYRRTWLDLPAAKLIGPMDARHPVKDLAIRLEAVIAKWTEGDDTVVKLIDGSRFVVGDLTPEARYALELDPPADEANQPKLFSEMAATANADPAIT